LVRAVETAHLIKAFHHPFLFLKRRLIENEFCEFEEMEAKHWAVETPTSLTPGGNPDFYQDARWGKTSGGSGQSHHTLAASQAVSHREHIAFSAATAL